MTLTIASVLLLRALEDNLVDDIRETDEVALQSQIDRVTSQGIPPGAQIVTVGDVEAGSGSSVFRGSASRSSMTKTANRYRRPKAVLAPASSRR